MGSSSRRTFLKTSALATATLAVGARARAASLNFPIGLQLYSVRELLPKSFERTLAQLSAAGYKEVEAAGYWNKTAAEWKRAMDQAGLRCVSTHHPLALLKQKEDELIEYGHNIGLEYMVCSSAGMHRDPSRKGELTLDDWRWVAEEFNRIGEKVKAAGMHFGYHNHTPEFGTENGVVFYDELLKLTDPKLVCYEMDCGWVSVSGHDPMAYLNKWPDRFPLLHVKDMAKNAEGKFHSVVLGHGVVDYRPIFKAATGLKHYFVEQEEFTGDILAELSEDADYMKHFSV